MTFVRRDVAGEIPPEPLVAGLQLHYGTQDARARLLLTRRGALRTNLVVQSEPEPEGKARIAIRLDQDIVDRFFQMAEASGGGTGYQTLINAALREYLDGKSPWFEDALRRIIRGELKASAA